jgi:hypothetical protein
MALTSAQKIAINAEFTKQLGKITPKITSEQMQVARTEFEAFLETQ